MTNANLLTYSTHGLLYTREDSHQYSRCQGTAAEDATIQTSIQAEADSRLSSASDVSNVEVVSS